MQDLTFNYGSVEREVDVESGAALDLCEGTLKTPVHSGAGTIQNGKARLGKAGFVIIFK